MPFIENNPFFHGLPVLFSAKDLYRKFVKNKDNACFFWAVCEIEELIKKLNKPSVRV